MKYLILITSILFTMSVFSASPVTTGGDSSPKKEIKPSPSLFLSGSVIDQETGEKLAGAKIEIEDAGITTYTDIHGNFILEAKDLGSHKCKISYISYENKELAAQEITVGQEVTISLKPLW